MAGTFITVEGIEGVGKTTNLGFIAEWLESRGEDVVLTREPGGTPAAEAVRQVLLSTDPPVESVLAELLLIFAARAIHIEQLIGPALERGAFVVSDRFTDATYAYQGAGRGVSSEAVAALEGLVQNGLKPDLTILLDVPVEISRARIEGRGGTDRFEQEQGEFFGRVRDAYLTLARSEPQRVQVVDASQSLAEVQSRIAGILAGLY